MHLSIYIANDENHRMLRHFLLLRDLSLRNFFQVFLQQ